MPNDTLQIIPTLFPREESLNDNNRYLDSALLETFTENLRMRLNLYYLGGSLEADQNLNTHIEAIRHCIGKHDSNDHTNLHVLLSHNYQLKGLIARDQLDYHTAKECFQKASLYAQQGNCVELNALAMARQAGVYVIQKQFIAASRVYETAREISKHSQATLRAYLAIGYAEVQGQLGNDVCLASLDEARRFMKRVDPQDDEFLLLHSTRCSTQAIEDCFSQCSALIGKPAKAIEHYDSLIERKADLSMTRKQARMHIQYAEALYLNKDLSCCFYMSEGMKLARATSSKHNIQRAQELLHKLLVHHRQDARVQELLQEMAY